MLDEPVRFCAEGVIGLPCSTILRAKAAGRQMGRAVSNTSPIVPAYTSKHSTHPPISMVEKKSRKCSQNRNCGIPKFSDGGEKVDSTTLSLMSVERLKSQVFHGTSQVFRMFLEDRRRKSRTKMPRD
jgi:hypothetical protein